MNLIVFNKELQGDWRPEAWGAFFLIVLNNSVAGKGGRTLRRLPEQCPYYFQQGIVRKLEAGQPGGFRSNFMIAFKKDL